MRRSTPTAAILLALSAAAHAQVIVDISDPNCTFPIFPSLSADGGTACSDDSCGPFKWDNVLGVQRLTTSIAGTFAINADGSIVVGLTPPPNYRPARILPGNVFNDLGIPPGLQSGFPTDISHDGTIVVGSGQQNSAPFLTRGFRWDNGIYSLLPLPAGEGYGSADCISGDGQAVFGFTYPPPATTRSLTRWRIGVPIDRVGAYTFPASQNTHITAANPNGTYAVGHTDTNGTDVQPYRWSQANGIEELTLPAWATHGKPGDLTADGIAVVGQLGNQSLGYRAGFWTETHGWTRLDEYLPTVGVNLNGWILNDCLGVSDDGTVLVGRGVYNNVNANWLVRNIPPICGSRIDAGPSNTVACANTTTQLVCIATPASTLSIQSHQWYKRVVSGTGFIDIPLTSGPTGNGSTLVNASGFTPRFGTSSLGFTNVSMADAGDYFCTITSGCGSNTTALVNLLVRPNINNDNVIDGADLSVLLANFGNNVTPWTSGDFNGDGIVNSADLSTLLANFGQPCA